MACTPSNIPLFPYTTLFRSKRPASASCRQALLRDEFRSTFENPAFVSLGILSDCGPKFYGISKLQFLNKTVRFPQIGRDTSELQSRFDLVCRLLLEKKNKIT